MKGLMSKIRLMKLTIPGIKEITFDERTYDSLLLEARSVQLTNADGPQRLHELHVAGIKIYRALTNQAEGKE